MLPNEGPPPAPDPAVPGLAALAEGQLDPLLEAAGALPLLRVRVLKQHVGSRCTLVVTGRSSTVVLKLFERPPTELVALHVAFRRAGLASGTGPTVAPMLAESAAAAAIVTAFFSEPPCRDLIVNGAAERAALLAGTWLQVLARSGIRAGSAYGSAEALLDTEGWRERLSRAIPELSARAGAVVRALQARPPAGSPPILAHGSYSASHVFDLGSGPGVIDWDGFRQAPPEFDAGRFLGGLSSLAAGRRGVEQWAARAAQAFLESVAAMLDPWALTWYRSAALLRLAYYATIRRPKRWEERAERLLAEAADRMAAAS